MKNTLFDIIWIYHSPLEYICTLLIGSFFTFGFLGLGGPSGLAVLDFIGSYNKLTRHWEMIIHIQNFLSQRDYAPLPSSHVLVYIYGNFLLGPSDKTRDFFIKDHRKH